MENILDNSNSENIPEFNYTIELLDCENISFTVFNTLKGINYHLILIKK